MKKLLLLLAVGALPGVQVLAEPNTGFQDWLKRDKALQKDATSMVVVGDFRLPLSLGWIEAPDSGADPGVVELAYVGPRATLDPAHIKGRLYVSTEALRDRGGPAEAWPSEFSGWASFQIGKLWAVRAEEPGDRDGQSRMIVQVPTSAAMLTAEFDIASAMGSWPQCLQQLLQALIYAGAGVPMAPPGEGDERVRAASRSPGVMVAADALEKSPLHEYAKQARQSMQRGVDPATENMVVILNTGFEALLARLHLIRSARHSIRIQTFIWRNDEIGRLFLYELVAAAQRGVKVEVIIDHISSFRDVELAAFVATASPNLTFRHYRPAGKRMDPAPLQEALDLVLPNHTNQRMHNKVFVVDDVVTITGGRNIDNSYYAQSSTINFRDRDVLFIGPMTAYAVRSFEEYWGFDKCERTARLKDVKKVIEKGKFKKLKTREDYALHGYFDEVERALADPAVVEATLIKPLRKVEKALFLADPPGKTVRRYTAWRRGTIARQLESVIKSAEHSLVLQTPYLILDGGMLKLLKGLHDRNPRFELSTSSNSFGATDNPIAYAANFKMRPAYMQAGINVYEYMHVPEDLRHHLPNYDELMRRNEMSRSSGVLHQRNKPFLCIHAKGFVVDDLVAFVGSYNFDPRSISLNTEVGLLVQDPAFAARLKQDIERDIKPENSWVVAKRKNPRSVGEVQRSLPSETTRARLNLWPFRYTSGYELRPGEPPVSPSVPQFYSYYKDVGAFPGADDEGMAMKTVAAHLATILSDLIVPLL